MILKALQEFRNILKKNKEVAFIHFFEVLLIYDLQFSKFIHFYVCMHTHRCIYFPLHIHEYIYHFHFILFPIMLYYKLLNIVPCAMW